MKKVFIIHGFGGVPNGGWLPWLSSELSKKGIFACALPMPNTNDPVVSEWVNKMASEVVEPNEEIFLVGHSLGVPAVLRYLESLKEGEHIGGAVLVSGVIEPIEVENPESEFRKIDPFMIPKIDFAKIKNIPKKITIVHGTADTVVPFTQAETLSKELGCELVKVEGGSHFSQKMEPICYELPSVLDAVLKIMNK